MNKFFDLPRIPEFAKAAAKIRTQGMDFLVSGVRNIVTRKIQDLYYVNLREAPWRNQHMLNVMLAQGYTLSYQLSPMSLTLTINEDVLFPSEFRASGLKNNWRNELRKEDLFLERREIARSDSRFFESVYKEVSDFVYKDFAPYVAKIVK